MENKNYLIPDIRNLKIKIYVIGASKQGESIIFVLYNGTEILFSALIDSYEEKGVNKAQAILEELKVSSLDLVCWSHPHDDHTLGLRQLMEKFCDKKKTTFLTPQGVVNRNNNINLSGSCLSVLDFFDDLHTSKRIIHNHKEIDTPRQNATPLFHRQIKDTFNKCMEFNVLVLSPIKTLITHYLSYRDMPHMSKNIFSISLLFDIGGKKFFFSSDIEDNTIKLMDTGVLSDLYYLKTPHHTSDSSKALYQILNEQNLQVPLAVTTVNRDYGLPNIAFVEKNKSIFSKFACTNKENKEGWGYVIYEHKLNNDSAPQETFSCYENAYLLKN